MFPIAEIPAPLTSFLDGKQFFDFYRLVDVADYEVFRLERGAPHGIGERCYDIWQQGKVCENCTSCIAAREKKQTIKMESVGGQIFLIVSQPVCVAGRELVLELAKQVTEHLMLSDQDAGGNVRAADYISKINALTVRDSFTGLYNRRFAQDELTRLLQRRNPGDALTIALLDIDKFKHINDTYGHLKGDEVILTVAAALTDCAQRSSGWACRIGGDEFLLAFPDCSADAASAWVRGLCQDVKDRAFSEGGSTFFVTLSAGMASFEPSMQGWRELYEAADRDMYRIKKERHTDAVNGGKE